MLTGEMGIDIKSGKGRGGYIRDVVFRRFRHTFGRTKCRSDLPCPEAPLDHENYGSQSEGWIQIEANDDHCHDDCPNKCVHDPLTAASICRLRQTATVTVTVTATVCLHRNGLFVAARSCFPDCSDPLAIPHIDNISFIDLHASGVPGGERSGSGNDVPAGLLQCVPESPCTNIRFENVTFPALTTEWRCDGHVHGTAAGVKTQHVSIGHEAEDISKMCGKGEAQAGCAAQLAKDGCTTGSVSQCAACAERHRGDLEPAGCRSEDEIKQLCAAGGLAGTEKEAT